MAVFSAMLLPTLAMIRNPAGGAFGRTIHTFLADLFTELQGVTAVDPGNAGAIPTTSRESSVPIVTAGAETRTLAIPRWVGQTMTIFSKTAVGNCVIATASAINAAGNNRITLATAGQSITLIGVWTGTALAWRILINDGTVALSTV